jgi:phosphohistidine phosphatase
VNLLIVRHAPAVDRDEFAAAGGGDDRDRPLTAEGRRKMRLAVRGLRRLIPRIDWLGASPLVRARQTAEILADRYGSGVLEVAELAPEGDVTKLWPVLRRGGGLRCVVGHEPHLSACIAYLLRGGAAEGSGSPPAITRLKKGGACLLEIEEPGMARIRWLAEPRLLRRQAR